MTDAIALRSSNVPAILGAREAVRAILAPTGTDLEALLIDLHRQSADSQRQARTSQAKARGEIYTRLEGHTVETDGTGTVVISIVTTRELIGLMEAESNLIKMEAMAQRSYDVHMSAQHGAHPAAGSLEEFIVALEQEERTDSTETP